MHLNLESVLSARSASPELFKVSEYKRNRKVKYHTIEFGKFPKSYVGAQLNDKLNGLFEENKLKATGKPYTGHMENETIIYNSQYEYMDNQYVRVKTKKYDNDSEYSDGTKAPESGTYLWVKVEPISWRINNWNDLPKALNPQGNGTADFIDVETEEAILSGIPFYPNYEDKNRTMWQNSTIRGYLNGINVNNIKTNGNPKYSAPNGGDFTTQNFLSEAFNLSLVKKAQTDLDINYLPEEYRKAYALGAGMLALQDTAKKRPTESLIQGLLNKNSILENKSKLPKIKVSKQAIKAKTDKQTLKEIKENILVILDLDESFVKQYKKELTKIILENSIATIEQKLELLEVINNSTNNIKQ